MPFPVRRSWIHQRGYTWLKVCGLPKYCSHAVSPPCITSNAHKSRLTGVPLGNLMSRLDQCSHLHRCSPRPWPGAALLSVPVQCMRPTDWARARARTRRSGLITQGRGRVVEQLEPACLVLGSLLGQWMGGRGAVADTWGGRLEPGRDRKHSPPSRDVGAGYCCYCVLYVAPGPRIRLSGYC